jgi:hypothetical protein
MIMALFFQLPKRRERRDDAHALLALLQPALELATFPA